MFYDSERQENFPDHKYDQVWNRHKNLLKPKKINKLHMNRLSYSEEPKKCPKRLLSLFEMYKYFSSHTAFHGVRYWVDKQLHLIENILWFIAAFAAFSWAILLIIKTYNLSQIQRTITVIDEINYDIFNTPFPSVSFCPPTRVDWKKAIRVINEKIPPSKVEARNVLTRLLKEMWDIRFAGMGRFSFLKTDYNLNDSSLQILNDINVTALLMEVTTTCEQYLIECEWKFHRINCCEIFELQKTYSGFCYGFNSLSSVNETQKEPMSTHSFGLHSGLRVLIQADKLNYPPISLAHGKNLVTFTVTHPSIMPYKGRFIRLGRQYYVDIKVISGYASSEVLALEHTTNPPCKYENGYYKYENCFITCRQKYIIDKCGCNPILFFPYVDGIRQCDIKDLSCLGPASDKLLESNRSMPTKGCHCPMECEYCEYDNFISSVPFNHTSLFLDIHFDGPTSVRYKKKIFITEFEMFVQVGAIFGLFIGGSFLSFIECVYCLVVGIFSWIYRVFRKSSCTN